MSETPEPLAKKNVLIVDDGAVTRRFIRSVLEAEKREPFAAEEPTTGAECLQTATNLVELGAQLSF